MKIVKRDGHIVVYPEIFCLSHTYFIQNIRLFVTRQLLPFRQRGFQNKFIAVLCLELSVCRFFGIDLRQLLHFVLAHVLLTVPDNGRDGKDGAQRGGGKKRGDFAAISFEFDSSVFLFSHSGEIKIQADRTDRRKHGDNDSRDKIKLREKQKAVNKNRQQCRNNRCPAALFGGFVAMEIPCQGHSNRHKHRLRHCRRDISAEAIKIERRKTVRQSRNEKADTKSGHHDPEDFFQ